MTDRLLLLSTAAAAGALGFIAGKRDVNLKHLLNGNHKLLSASEKRVVRALAEQGQKHLFVNWPPPGVNDDAKRSFIKAASNYLENAPEELESCRLGLLQPPLAKQDPRTLEAQGDIREDPYYWMRDDSRKDPEVLKHLKAENQYTKAVLASTEEVQEQLYQEMRGRIQEADTTIPVRRGGYFYYSRTEEGQQYKASCRRKVPPHMEAIPPSEDDVMDETVPEEVLLDENEAAKKHAYFMVGDGEESPDGSLYAWTQDTVGGETYSLHVKDLQTGKEVTPAIEGVGYALMWAADNKTLFYTTLDHIHRAYRVHRHTIGAGTHDVLVYEEADEAFEVDIFASRSKAMLFIRSSASITAEERYLPSDRPHDDWTLAIPRVQNVEYEMYHRGNHFFILHRDAERPNSELRVARAADITNHQVVVPHSAEVKLESVVVSQGHIVLFQRIEGLQQATVYALPQDGSAPSALTGGRKVAFDEPAYSLHPGRQGDFTSPVIALSYTSLATPASDIHHNLHTGASATKKVQPVLGGFQAALYETQRLWAPAPDGTLIPISLVFRKDIAALDGSAPCLLAGYGAYEVSNDPYFSSSRLCLLDRGWVYGIAHVRGGGEMGRHWYEEGKYDKKVNTFTDFIAASEHLLQQGVCHPEKLCIEGRSAGGLTMGAVLNMRPDLFSAALVVVPFVDVLTTMLDTSIPLTIGEWDEWGNPADSPAVYATIKAYSPVDNVRTVAYPHMLVTAGLHDPRVGYWEPAKFVAKIREMNPGSSKLLLFKCDLGAGHFSQSGRFERLREVCVEHAFLLKTQGMLHVQPPAASSKL